MQKSGQFVPTAEPQGAWPGHTLATLSSCSGDSATLAQLFFSCVTGDGTRQFLPLSGPIPHSGTLPGYRRGRSIPRSLTPSEWGHHICGCSRNKKGPDMTLHRLAAALGGQNQLPGRYDKAPIMRTAGPWNMHCTRHIPMLLVEQLLRNSHKYS